MQDFSPCSLFALPLLARLMKSIKRYFQIDEYFIYKQIQVWTIDLFHSSEIEIYI